MKLRILLPAALFLVISCSPKIDDSTPPVVIPDRINGTIREFSFTPTDINTPDAGTFLITVTNNIYKVKFNAVEQAQSNATLKFESDTVLIKESREFANLGKDFVAYQPLAENEVVVSFHDGRMIFGLFDINTNFGGTFGEALISQWREANDPAKPNEKAVEDISNFVKRYADKDGAGPGIAPVYLRVDITKL